MFLTRAGSRVLSRLASESRAASLTGGLIDASSLWARGVAVHSRKGPLRSGRFVDWLRVTAIGGQGGSGSTSFWHSRIRHRKGADGGNGGNGSDVVLQARGTLASGPKIAGRDHGCHPASVAVRCLGNVMPHLKGRRGAAGGKHGSAGARGEDTVILVPVGTRVWVAAEDMQPSSLLPRGVTEDTGPALCAAALQPGDAAGGAAAAADSECDDDEDSDGGGPRDRGYDSDDEEDSDDDDDDDFDDDDDDDDEFPRQRRLEPPRGAAAARRSGLALLADLSADGASVVAARGGRGGRGNLHLDTDRPGSWRDRAEAGADGETRRLLLEMCSVADVGLVGPPNVGKSSLLGVMTNAKPEVGDYAFTTLRPQLGRLVAGGPGSSPPPPPSEFGPGGAAADADPLAATVADIPGLIPGAHENRGLGHAFLRHVERCSTLVVVVDLSLGLKGGSPGPRPWDQFDSIVNEVHEYEPTLLARVALCVGTKLDRPGARRAFGALKSRLEKREGGGVPAFALSSVSGEGVGEFREALLRAAAEEKRRRREAAAAAEGEAGPGLGAGDGG